MKIILISERRNESGMAVIAVIAMIALMLIFVAGNLRMLHLLRNDLKLVERQQTNRLAHASLLTNTVPVTPSFPKLAPQSTAPEPSTK